MLFLDAIAALLILAGMVSLGGATAAAILRGRGPLVFAGAAYVATFWWAAVLFHVLALAAGFQTWLALGVLALLNVLLLWARDVRSALQAEWLSLAQAAATAFGRALKTPWSFCFAPLALIVFLMTMRSLYAPPMAHDSLTYHLYKAGRWVHEGALVFEQAPGAWQYHEWFPWLGSAFSAWAMLPLSRDSLVGVVGSAQWLGLLGGLYLLARELGAQRLPALLVAGALASAPCNLGMITSGYVDHASAGFWALGAGLLAHATRRRDGACGVFAVAAMSVAAGLKFTFTPLLGVVVLLVAAFVVAWGAQRAKLLALAVVALLPVLFVSVITWVHTGSPTYPFSLPLLSHVFPGNEALAEIMSSSIPGVAREPLPAGESFAYLLLTRSRPHWPHVNFGPFTLLLIGLSTIWVVRTLLGRFDRSGGSAKPEDVRKGPVRQPWPAIVFLMITAAAVGYGFFSSDYLGQRTYFLNTSARLLFPAMAVLTIWGALAPRRLACGVAGAAVLLNPLYILPWGVHPDEWSVLLASSAVWILAAAGAWYVFLRKRPATSSGRRLGVLGFGVLVPALLCGSVMLGEVMRQPLQKRMEPDEGRVAYNFHPAGFSLNWEQWWAVETERPLTVAFAAGVAPNAIDHNWLRYPLLGSRLQNRVVYVPITDDGEVIGYSEEEKIDARASETAWLRRLHDQDVDVVVPGPPFPIEYRWAASRPELFAPAFAPGSAMRLPVFWVRKDRLAAFLGEE